MNRKHKFRGKAAKDWRWAYGWYAEEPGGESIIYPFDTPWMPIIVIPYTVGEFTGLHDEKRTAEYPEGQEIWEGDKVFWSWSAVHNHIEGNIEWSERRLAWLITNTYFVNNREVLLCDYLSGLEVVGNVHDEEAHNG